jgi:imidazolonepropionase-like amidohydrolase
MRSLSQSRLYSGASLILLFAWAVLWPAHASAEQVIVAVTNVTVIDPGKGKSKPKQTVLISGERIAEVGRSSRVNLPANTRMVDGTGKFLIPGLWDMHAHLEEDFSKTNDLLLYIANGVTGVRIMWGAPTHHKWRKLIDAGELVGPRMLIGSRIVDGPKPAWPGSITAANEAEGRQAVRKAKQEDADFIKVYDLLPREAYFGIADEAKKQNIPFEGHLPHAISIEEASRAGQKSIEHLTGIIRGCSSREGEISKELRKGFDLGTPDTNALARLRANARLALETYSPAKAKKIFAVLKQNQTWQCPTFTVLHGMAFMDEPSLTNDFRLKYISRDIRAGWNPERFFRFARSPGDVVLEQDYFHKQLEVVGAMEGAGVPILAGTDTPNPWCFPGFGLHDELAWLAQARLTPMQALQAATLNPARFMGRDKELGTVEKGMLADLVLLDANPLEDIHNTTRIRAVFANGRFYDRATLDAFLHAAESKD